MSHTKGKADDPASGVAGSGTLLLATALGLLILLAWRLSDVLVLLFGAVILAVALGAVAPRPAAPAPPVAAVRGRRHGGAHARCHHGRRLAGLVAQASDLRERLPEARTELSAWANSFRLGVALQELWADANTEDVPWASVANATTRTMGAIGSMDLLLVVGVYLAADPTLYRLGLVRLLPPAHRARIDGALVAGAEALGRWLLGQGVSMLFVGSATAIGLALLGVPMALTVGLIAGVLAFVPFIGPIASDLLTVLLAFTQGPTPALYVAGLPSPSSRSKATC